MTEENSLKRSLQSFEHPVGNWISMGHPAPSEVTAKLGFDFVLIDTEHTTIDLKTVEHLDRAVCCIDSVTEAIVRLPNDDPTKIKRVLDIGVAGIMIPMVETADQARDIVESVRYPPGGNRGIAGGRAAGYGMDFPKYIGEANGSLVTIVQIETRRGLENAEEIAAVDGIDALFIGPADLSGALDVLGQWEADEFSDAIDHVIEAGTVSETPVGTLAVDPDLIETRVRQGFDYMIIGKDISYIAESSRQAKERYDDAVERGRSTGTDISRD